MPPFGEDPVEAVIATKLGGEKVLHTHVRGLGDLARVVGEGLPLDVLDHMRASGRFREGELSRILPARTAQHRRASRRGLTPEESDKAVRLLRIQTLAEQTFGSVDKADRWLRRPLRALDDQEPLRVAETEAGGRLVERLLVGIAWGAAA
ncbi:MAG: DUF2384 domain-containing protein [Caenispirillum bisanense]|nr:DUF2384 domain-containing protein [Caenispirillum bisanense]MCA1971878.1 DUF2384 domain-containing protein [Caenispirillum sp.]